MDENSNPGDVRVRPLKSFEDSATGIFRTAGGEAFTTDRGRVADLKANGLVTEDDAEADRVANPTPIASVHYPAGTDAASATGLEAKAREEGENDRDNGDAETEKRGEGILRADEHGQGTAPAAGATSAPVIPATPAARRGRPPAEA